LKQSLKIQKIIIANERKVLEFCEIVKNLEMLYEVEYNIFAIKLKISKFRKLVK